MEALSKAKKIERLERYKKDAPFFPKENIMIKEKLLALKNSNRLENEVNTETLDSYKGRCFYTFCPVHKYDTTPKKAITITIKEEKDVTKVSFHEEVCYNELLSNVELNEHLQKLEEYKIDKYIIGYNGYSFLIGKISIKFIN